MSRDRALRKQQQLNNLVAAVKKLAKPGDVIVDFCSGGVRYIFSCVAISFGFCLCGCTWMLLQSTSTYAEILTAFGCYVSC